MILRDILIRLYMFFFESHYGILVDFYMVMAIIIVVWNFDFVTCCTIDEDSVKKTLPE